LMPNEYKSELLQLLAQSKTFAHCLSYSVSIDLITFEIVSIAFYSLCWLLWGKAFNIFCMILSTGKSGNRNDK
jgi:hypothetical protein